LKDDKLELFVTTQIMRCADPAWNLVRRGRGIANLISKPRNSHRNGKIDLLCISVWDGAGLYYCQEIVAFPSRKGFVGKH